MLLPPPTITQRILILHPMTHLIPRPTAQCQKAVHRQYQLLIFFHLLISLLRLRANPANAGSPLLYSPNFCIQKTTLPPHPALNLLLSPLFTPLLHFTPPPALFHLDKTPNFLLANPPQPIQLNHFLTPCYLFPSPLPLLQPQSPFLPPLKF